MGVGYCTIRCWRGGFSKLTRSVRESRGSGIGGRASRSRARIRGGGRAGEEEGERLVERGGGGQLL